MAITRTEVIQRLMLSLRAYYSGAGKSHGLASRSEMYGQDARQQAFCGRFLAKTNLFTPMFLLASRPNNNNSLQTLLAFAPFPRAISVTAGVPALCPCSWFLTSLLLSLRTPAQMPEDLILRTQTRTGNSRPRTSLLEMYMALPSPRLRVKPLRYLERYDRCSRCSKSWFEVSDAIFPFQGPPCKLLQCFWSQCKDPSRASTRPFHS